MGDYSHEYRQFKRIHYKSILHSYFCRLGGMIMTREDIEQLNVVEPYCFESDREEQWYNIGLKHGLEIADNNPKSPWISVKDDLPCNHPELVDDYIYTNQVLVKIHDGIFITTRMTYRSRRWEWFCDGKITHWMPIPKLPKE